MANLSISGLTAGAAVSNTDLFPDVQTVGIGPVKVTGLQIKTYCSSAPTLINPQINNTVLIGQPGIAQGSIVLANTNILAVSATIASSNATTANWTLTLPADAGSPNQALITDGSGVTSWGSPSIANLSGGAASQLVYQTSSTTTGFIANGTASQVLISAGAAAPAWGALDLSSSTAVANVLAVANGGTGMSTVGTAGQALVSDGTNIVYGTPAAATNLAGGTANQVPYQTAANTTAFVTAGTAGTVLTAGVAGLPAWSKVDLSSSATVDNVLPIANGGTNLSTVGAAGTVPISDGTGLAYGVPDAAKSTNLAGGAASQVPYQTAADTTAFIPNGVAGQFLQSNGAAAPSWEDLPAPSYHIAITTGGTIASKIAAAGITDLPGNFYTFINSGANNITLTAAIVDNAAAYPLNISGTNIIVQSGGTLGVNTITANTEYSVDVFSPITGSLAIALSSSSAPAASTTVDKYSVLTITGTGAAGYTFTLPSPTNTLPGKIVTIINNGAAAFYVAGTSLYTAYITPNTSMSYIWSGTKWTSINSTAINLFGGLIGTVPYQTGTSTTGFVSAGAKNTVLTTTTPGSLSFQPVPTAYYTSIGLATTQSISPNGTIFPPFVVNEGDPYGYWNATTKRWTPTTAGVYCAVFQATFGVGSSTTGQYNIQILKNGNTQSILQAVPATGTDVGIVTQTIATMNGSTDYLTFSCYSSPTSSVVGDVAYTFTQVSIFKLTST